MDRGYGPTVTLDGLTPDLARLQKRFWACVPLRPVDEESCWLWAGMQDKKGYGRLNLWDGQTERGIKAHRLAYLMEHGRIDAGLCVLHRCDTPACVRVSHLFLGTQQANQADKVAKARQARGERHGFALYPERHARGERSANAKLTDEQRAAIFNRYRAGGITQTRLASLYGVRHSTIGKIITAEDKHRQHRQQQLREEQAG